MPENRTAKIAVVTGGASGIGLGIAERLAADGAAVAVLNHDGAAAAAAAASITATGATALGLGVDVSDRTRVESAVETVHAHFGAVTILVNNAGMEGFQPFLKSRAGLPEDIGQPAHSWSPTRQATSPARSSV